MQLNQNNTEVLTIISQTPAGIATKDIFNSLVEQYKDSALTIPDDVSKVVYNLRGKRFITTDDTRKKNVHKITKTGESILWTDNVERLALAITADITEPEPTAIEPTGAKPVRESVLEPLTLTFTHEELDDLVSTRIKESRLDNMKADQELAVILTKQAGYTVLSPLDELHAAFIAIINSMEATVIHPGIARKTQKIDTLSRLGNLMAVDIKIVLDDIITDLTRLEELA